MSDGRNQLGDDIIEAGECLKSWTNAALGEGGEGTDIQKIKDMLVALQLHAGGF
jgi:hypothetical protein